MHLAQLKDRSRSRLSTPAISTRHPDTPPLSNPSPHPSTHRTQHYSYKQIASIVMSPTFPGWLAPLSFNPDRWLEFVSLTCTLTAAWVLAAALTGGLNYSATRSLPAALAATSWAWLVAMPVAAAQLVLETAWESKALVGSEGFSDALPLAAQVGCWLRGSSAARLGRLYAAGS